MAAFALCAVVSLDTACTPKAGLFLPVSAAAAVAAATSVYVLFIFMLDFSSFWTVRTHLVEGGAAGAVKKRAKTARHARERNQKQKETVY